MSRTLQALTQAEAVQIGQALQTISQPFIDQEVLLALRDRGRLVYDGDLTGRPVSNTSTTYPNVAYGHMSDAIHWATRPRWSACTAPPMADCGCR